MPHLENSMRRVFLVGWIPAEKFIRVAAVGMIDIAEATGLVRGFVDGDHVLWVISPAGSASYGMGIDF